MAKDKTLKQLESIVGRDALRFHPFAGGRTSEVVFNAFILSVLAQKGSCWPYRIIQLFREQWSACEGRLKAIGLKEPTNLGIQLRVEDLEREGFIHGRTLKRDELAGMTTVSRRASKVYDLTSRGYALAWLLNLIRNDNEAMLTILKRMEKSGSEMPGGLLLIKLLERKKTPYFLRHAVRLGTIRLLGEIEEDKVESGPEFDIGLKSAFLPQQPSKHGKDIAKTIIEEIKPESDEEYFWWRHLQLVAHAIAETGEKIHLLSQGNQLRYLSYLRAIGSPERIKEEIVELDKVMKEDPEVRSSLMLFKDQMSEYYKRIGI